MKKRLLGNCPVCGDRFVVTELTCKNCDSKLQGEFQLSKFDYLSTELQEFALVFIKNAGNIKGVEKDLGVSYPTVKKNLTELIRSLGYESREVLSDENLSREEVLRALKQKEISFEEAEKMLKELN